MAFWRATDVDLPQNSAIVTVNTGDDVGTITSGYIIQINTGQFLEVKTVNTGASPQTIELYQIYTGTAINGGTAIAAPTQGAIKEATEELRALRTTYESLADSVSSTATANSVVKRNGSAQVLVANATANNHAMAFGQYTNPLDYGIGVDIASGSTNQLSAVDLNTIKTSGFYYVTGASTNQPFSTNGFLAVFNSTSTDYVTQRFTDDGGSNVYIRNCVAGVWQDWVEVYHSGNSANPLDYGVGTYFSGNGTPADLKNVSADGLKGGLYTGYEGNNTNATLGDNPWPSSGGAYGLLNMTGVNTAAGDYTTQLAIRQSFPEMKFRASAISGLSAWQTVYHSGNTNFNEFGGLAANDEIAIGFALSTTLIRFYIPINEFGSPTSVSVLAGTFKVVNMGGTDLTTGLSSLSLAGQTTNRMLVVQATVSGATQKEAYKLVSETSDFKFTYTV